MITETRVIARVYPSAELAQIGLDSFLREHASEVASVEFLRRVIHTHDAKMIYFISMRNIMDIGGVAGNNYQTIIVHPLIDEECRMYLWSRMRHPTGRVDDKLTEMEV